jgi:tRNA threonylcarbamoyl adenosine modification protein YeaZ
MYSLSISTSGKYISVAIHDDKLISSSSVLSENGTTNLLMKSIDEITKKSRIEKSDINVVYLDIGPGYYTSLRIGLAVAQGVCGSLGIPLVPVNGLDALAFAAHTGHRKITQLLILRERNTLFVYISQYRVVL